MTVVLVAHGTRDPRGVDMVGRLAADIAARRGEEVAVSFVDVLGPSPSELLGSLPPGPVTLLPAFLARGHHVRVDIPRHVRGAGREVRLAQPLGPSRLLARALHDRLAEAGTTCNGAVVLAAAGSADPRAQRDVETVARLLSARLAAPVHIAFASTPADSPHPSVTDAVAEARRRTGGPVAVASYLLADGLFQRRLDDSGADVVARPLGLAGPVIELACHRIDVAEALFTRRSPVDSRA
ncbi:MAG: CbiX/SirB N-terminal domain-containing protein [Gordonia sp. (in: high G+C Gram-positive bacteria)]|uniref:sirohydrochlorin chelatase n=1 Tax=Gordonia TaxID=2053 RepID=UPI0032661AEB